MPSAYLDASVLIPVGQAARSERGAQRARRAGRIGREMTWVASDLVRLECKVRPLAARDEGLFNDIERFFRSPALVGLSFPPATFDRAAGIRARHGIRTPDALHLGAALEAGCGVFVPADRRLAAFAEIPVALLAME